MTVLHTPRLMLRPFRPEDLAALAALLADPEVMRYSVHGPLDLVTVREQTLPSYIESIDHPQGLMRLAIELLAGGQMIGFVGLGRQTLDGRDEVETGYRLFREYWGQGYATEAVIAMREFAFGPLGLERLIAVIDPQNVRSQRVAEKAGLAFEKLAPYHGRLIRVYAALADGTIPQRAARGS